MVGGLPEPVQCTYLGSIIPLMSAARCLPEKDDMLQLPFHGAEESLRSARSRAGIGAQGPAGAACSAPHIAVQSAATFSLALEAVVLSVPYGQKPGVAIRSAELWVAAMRQVGFSSTLEDTQASNGPTEQKSANFLGQVLGI